MARNSLTRLGRAYPDTLVGLERFGRLVNTASAALRARRTPDSGIDFPNPAGSGTSNRFQLGELVEWATAAGLAGRANDDEIQVFALECAVRRCSRIHGAEATLRFLGGVALFVAAGWRPARTSQWSIIEQLRRDDAPRREPRLSKALVDGGFRPDLDPADDPDVRSTTIEWKGSGRTGPHIPNDSPEGARLVNEIRATWAMTERAGPSEGSGLRNERFAREIDEHLLQLFASRGRRSSITPAMVSSTMAALAPLAPGSLVCDPAMGAATTLIELVSRSDSARLQTIGVIGRDEDELAWTVAKVRLGIRDIAHELGRPGCNSLDPNELHGPFHVVVCEPSIRRRNYGKWFDLCRRLLGPDGTAVLALPADVLRSDFRSGKWWDIESGHLETLVVTPVRRASRRNLGWVICTTRAEPPRSGLVRAIVIEQSSRQLQTRERVQMDRAERDLAPMDRPQIAAVAAVAEQRDDRSDPDLGITARSIANDAGVVSTFIDEVTERRLVGADLVHARRSRRSPVASGLETELEFLDELRKGIALAPRRFVDPDRPRPADAALAAVDLLRWLADPDPEVDALELDPALRTALAGESTEEIRRALKRFRQRLVGEETRGRKKRADAAD